MNLPDLEAVVGALDGAGVRFIVVGGLAVAFHGYSRTTYDLDLVVGLEPANIVAAFRALEQLGYRPLVPVTAAQFADSTVRQRWIEEKGMKVLNFNSDRHRETNVDIFVSEPFDFAQEYENAYLQELIPGTPLRVARLETMIAMKRAAGRGKDLADIDELMSVVRGGEP
jgi:predicted nucleotidyltransferase